MFDEVEAEPLGCCQGMSSYVLNHEFIDLTVHDKGSAAIKFMSTCQCAIRILYYVLLFGVIGLAFYYPIMQETSTGNVKRIRTFTSPNAVQKKELTLVDLGLHNFIVLKEKKDEVKKHINETWYYPKFFKLNPDWRCE